MSLTIKSPVSEFGKELAELTTAFIKINQEVLMKNPNQVTSDIGAQTLGNAIGYAIAKALISPTFIAAINTGTGLTAGQLISGALTSTIQEP